MEAGHLKGKVALLNIIKIDISDVVYFGFIFIFHLAGLIVDLSMIYYSLNRQLTM